MLKTTSMVVTTQISAVFGYIAVNYEWRYINTHASVVSCDQKYFGNFQKKKTRKKEKKNWHPTFIFYSSKA